MTFFTRLLWDEHGRFRLFFPRKLSAAEAAQRATTEATTTAKRLWSLPQRKREAVLAKLRRKNPAGCSRVLIAMRQIAICELMSDQPCGILREVAGSLVFEPDDRRIVPGKVPGPAIAPLPGLAVACNLALAGGIRREYSGTELPLTHAFVSSAIGREPEKHVASTYL